jgi:hypothetical protein
MAETWRPIPGYEGRYDVSDQGRVRSWLGWGKPVPHVLACDRSSLGYVRVTLHLSGRQSTITVHRLVMQAFVGPPPEGLEVRHLDGDRTNNRLSNLRYGTASENMQDRIRHGNNQSLNKTHCPVGHPYDEANTWISSDGGRHCRACQRDRQRARRARQSSRGRALAE